ncbi:hypothetical protein BsWGS_21711 [Bradybaena similaris]
MGLILAASMLLGVLSITVNGQQTVCPVLPAFTMAATRLANQANNPNQYFVIGGMFDVSEKGDNAFTCNASMSDAGFLNMVAFFWGINKYFDTIMLNKPMRVGAVAFDNCKRYEQTIENMYDYAQCRININDMAKENLVAYVGPYENVDAERTGTLAADLGITIFSPNADSMSLTAKDQRTLLKMRPSFMFDLQGIVAFLKNVNAGFVIILYTSDDPYWKAAYEELTRQIHSSSTATMPLCIQYTADMSTSLTNTTVDNLKTKVSVKYIVPLMPKSKLSDLMTEINNRRIGTLSNFIFILTSRIGRDRQLLEGQSALANNTIIIDLAEPADFSGLMSEFNSFLLRLSTNDTTPGLFDGVGKTWITNYLQKKRPPVLTANTYEVPSPVKYSVYYTLSSVRAVIEGMDSAFSQCGGGYQFCGAYRNQDTKSISKFTAMKKLSQYMSNSGDLLYSNIKYTVYMFINMNDLSSTITFQPIGNIIVDNNGIVSIVEDLKTGTYGNLFGSPSCPNPGQGQCCEVMTTTVPMTTAMPGGNTSSAVQTTPSKYSQVKYPVGQVITGAFSEDERGDNEYGTRFDRGQKWIIALGVLAGLGILCVIVFEIYILYKLLGTPTGSRWRTMWLGQLLLFGIFLCYLVLFAYLPIPTKATCGITRFGVGVSYAFCFAVLLVKLMVILTSKPNDVLLPGDVETPNYLKGTYQFLMFIFAVGVQVVIDIQWLITVPPEAIKVISNSGEKVWICNHYTWEAGSMPDMMSAFVRTEFENHLMSLIYIMVMILITTVLALMSHGIITNHRESIFIGIASGFTIPIWLAWGLVGGLNRDHDYAHEFADACIAFGLLITASLILFSMFLPKVRHLVNMGIEGIYLEDDRETIYGGSVILAPPSYRSKGSGSVIVLNNPGMYSEPVVINGDPMATHLKHPGSVYSVPANYMKHPDSMYGGSTRVLRVTDDLRGRYPQKRSQSEVAYGASRRPRSHKGTLPRSRSQTNLGAL